MSQVRIYVTSVSDSCGNAYTLAVGPTTGTGLSQSIYYAKDIMSGNNAVTVTFNQAAANPRHPDIGVSRLGHGELLGGDRRSLGQ